MKIYVCTKCGAVYKGDGDTVPECGSCHEATVFSGYNEEEWYAYTAKEREELKESIKQGGTIQREDRPDLGSILLTSGFGFEGYRITKYLDYCTGICVLGTGFLSSLSAAGADLFGDKSKGYEDKLEQAKDYAISDMKKRAFRVGGNAIIGTSLSLTTFSRDVIGIVVTGTVVTIESV